MTRGASFKSDACACPAGARLVGDGVGSRRQLQKLRLRMPCGKVSRKVLGDGLRTLATGGWRGRIKTEAADGLHVAILVVENLAVRGCTRKGRAGLMRLIRQPCDGSCGVHCRALSVGTSGTRRSPALLAICPCLCPFPLPLPLPLLWESCGGGGARADPHALAP